MKSTEEFSNILHAKFPFKPTPGQKELIEAISGYVISKKRFEILVTRGYAGTGKTTTISALVAALKEIKRTSVLLAPTGRAAKVMAGYAKVPAYTIHKKIYQMVMGKEGFAYFELAPNPHKNTLFIIDEASMISTSGVLPDGSFNTHDLLEDLMRYVYRGKGCKILLVGDSAQLPPVGMGVSPALDATYLKESYRMEIIEHELTEVMRQGLESGILRNATAIRELIRNNIGVQLQLTPQNDVAVISSEEFPDELESEIATHGVDGVMVITRSNKSANLYNQQIRARVLWLEDELAAGERLMVVKNNYHWLDEDSKAGFIANGDIVEVLQIKNTEEKYGLRFANAVVQLVDYPNEPELECKLLIDTLLVNGPSMPQAKMRELYNLVGVDYAEITNKGLRKKAILEDKYFNALQVKYGYAVTCHKSQGGQWPVVFIDQGYLTEDMLNMEYYRWLYTALTRASQKVYLVNFSSRFFEG